jgi:hypothetical protein
MARSDGGKFVTFYPKHRMLYAHTSLRPDPTHTTQMDNDDNLCDNCGEMNDRMYVCIECDGQRPVARCPWYSFCAACLADAACHHGHRLYPAPHGNNR